MPHHLPVVLVMMLTLVAFRIVSRAAGVERRGFEPRGR
jgi:hypothetical protein